MKKYFYYKCPECQFDCVTDRIDSFCCIICAEDCGRDVLLKLKETDTTKMPDKVEGLDKRKTS